ncbi:MAG: hypothetical protein RIF41_25000 [Polyangiaceae bacterium]
MVYVDTSTDSNIDRFLDLSDLGKEIDAATKLLDRIAAWKASRVELALWVERRRLRPQPRLERRPVEPPRMWGSCLRAFTAC